MTKRKAVFIGSAAVAVIAAAVVLINVFKKDGGYNFEYMSVENAVKNADSVLGETYENFTLPESLDIDVSGDLYTISADNITKTCDREELNAQLAELMDAGEKQSSKEDGIDMLESDYEHGIMWSYNSRTFTASRDLLTHPEIPLRSGKLYIVGQDDLSDKYILNGEEYSIKEAVEYAEKYANDKLMQFMINDSKVKAVAAGAFKVDEENYWIIVLLQHYMFGCPVSTTGSVSQDEPYMRPQRLVLTFDCKDDVGIVDNSFYPAVLDKKKVDKIISLPSALRYLEKELAPESNYIVTDLSLEYCSKLDTYSNEFEYRPMWCLTVAVGEGDHVNNVNIYPQKVIYIDALNGDICCYSEIEYSMIF